MFDACITRWDATHTNCLEIGYSQDSTGADVVDEDIRNDVEYFGVDVYTTVERLADHFGAETFTRKAILVNLKVTFWSHVSPEAGVTSAAGTA